jgi:hypothetical protein
VTAVISTTLTTAAVTVVAALGLLRPAPTPVHMAPDRADYFLPAPRTTDLHFAIHAAAAPPKARILLLSPLPAGPHQVHLTLTGARPDQTFVVALPVRRGPSTFTIDIDGPGRYDFGFWAEPVAPRNPQEARFTVRGPVHGHRLTVDFPRD